MEYSLDAGGTYFSEPIYNSLPNAGHSSYLSGNVFVTASSIELSVRTKVLALRNPEITWIYVISILLACLFDNTIWQALYTSNLNFL